MKFKLFFVLLLASSFGFAQTTLQCGSSNGVNTLTNSNSLLVDIDKCVTFKLYFHFLKQDNGSIVAGDPIIPSYTDYIDAIIAELHSYYPENIRFESTGYEVFLSSDYNYNSTEDEDFTARRLYDLKATSTDAIDVFFLSRVFNDSMGLFAGLADSTPSFACGVSYSYMEEKQRLLSHELGHVLNVFHTHHSEYPPNPSDCENTGDYVCDTPIDEGLYYVNEDNEAVLYVDEFCNYNGPQSPPPLTDNIMSYFVDPDIENACSNKFTQGQIARMLAPSTLSLFEGRMYIDDFDLAMRDNIGDDFTVPNYSTYVYDNSPDLWVRNNNSGDPMAHQNPVFNHPVYGNPTVKLRITNNGCSPSTGTETVSVYWTKANTWTAWPDDWNGTDPIVGGEVGTVTIPVLQGGESAIVSIPWSSSNAPNVAAGEQINSCLLARINGGTIDPIDEYSGELTHYLWVRNNNVVLRNLTIMNYEGGVMSADNIDFEVQNVKSQIVFFDFDIETDQHLLNEAELYFVLPSYIFSQYNLASNPGVSIHPRVQNAILITQPKVTLSNIRLDAKKRLLIKPRVNFLSSQVNHTQFTFRFMQKYHGINMVLGAEHYEINRSERTQFEAKFPNDIKLLKGESTRVLAEEIGEEATYNWYDANGKLLFTGKEIDLSVEQTQELKLEVIAKSDQYIDYDEHLVQVKPGLIGKVIPQPVIDHTRIEVKLSETCNSATLIILSPLKQAVGNYLVTATGRSLVNVDLSNHVAGWYQAVLVVNGIITDTQTFIKQ